MRHSEMFTKKWNLYPVDLFGADRTSDGTPVSFSARNERSAIKSRSFKNERPSEAPKTARFWSKIARFCRRFDQSHSASFSDRPFLQNLAGAAAFSCKEMKADEGKRKEVCLLSGELAELISIWADPALHFEYEVVIVCSMADPLDSLIRY
jgi:hypothetical protein